MRFPVFIISLLFSLAMQGQPDLTGTYGFSFENPGTAAKDDQAIPGGRLVLVKMEKNLYRFWLDVLSKEPEFDRMETDATVTFINDTASFDNTFEDAAESCILKFRKSGNSIIITSHGGPAGCGTGLQPDGTYTFLPKQQKLDNDWLKAQYPHAITLKVGSVTAELYSDQDGYQSFSPKRILQKGHEFISIVETEKTIYTEMIQPDGTLRHGWLRKSDVKLKD